MPGVGKVLALHCGWMARGQALSKHLGVCGHRTVTVLSLILIASVSSWVSVLHKWQLYCVFISLYSKGLNVLAKHFNRETVISFPID